ncbi:MAG: hypothetical protein K2P59_14820 [Acetatifactor sp.]|nr:hypothetical protein [Acetatifactor sp.]
MQYWDRIKAMMDKVLKTEKESKSIPTAGERKSESAGRENWRTGRIENRIDKLDEGDITELKAVYSAFATDDADLVRRAGKAVAGQLGGLQRPALLRLCEQFRDFTSLEWFIDWAKVSLDNVKKELSEEEYRYLLILGSFHPNGYFREKCIYEMAEYDGMLFWLFFRVNDWVRDIRTAACGVLNDYLCRVSAEELFDSMPAFERLQDCHRRSEDQMEKLWEQIETRLSLAWKDIDIRKIPLMEPAARSALYKALLRSKVSTLQEIDVILQQEKLSCLQRILIGGIFARPDCTVERAERYLTDSSAVNRRRAVEYKYEHLKTCWPGLERMLLDSSRGVREYAVYILEQHSSLDIREYYLDHLGEDKPEYAIMGLAEFGRSGNLPELMKCLERPERRVLKCTILALGYQEDFTEEELLWQYLPDDRNEISKAAYLSILRRDFYPGAERIYEAYIKSEAEHQKRYLLKLLLRESSWKRLPYLVRLYGREMPEEESRKVLSGIRNRFMYGKISQPLREDILLALEENGGALPEGMEKAILYDMKYV